MVSIVPVGTLVFGMQLPVQSQSLTFAEPWEREAGPAELAAVARAADEHGFFYVAVCDHVAMPRDLAQHIGTVWYDTIATLSWLAAQTRSVRLLSHVYVPAYRHPLVAAKAFCTLDALSGGRAIVGVGAGHVAGEFATLGVDFARRGALLDEAIGVLDAALREEFPGGGEVGVAPRPVQRPRPPIWVGGSSPAAVRRAARLGDGWLPQGNPREQMPELIDLLRKESAAAGRGDGPPEIGAITEWLYIGSPTWEISRPCRSGSPQQLAESLEDYRRMGVSHLQVRFPSRSLDELLDQIAAFGTEVAPLLG